MRTIAIDYQNQAQFAEAPITRISEAKYYTDNWYTDVARTIIIEAGLVTTTLMPGQPKVQEVSSLGRAFSLCVA